MTDEDGTPRPDPRQEPNPEPASDASGPKGDGARHPRISRFVGSRPLGKTIDLDIINDERALIKTPLAQSVRHVQTIEVATAEALAEVVRTCATDEALALGVCGREQARIVVADKLTPELKAKGVVARIKHNAETGEGFFRLSDGPGWVLIDADAGDPAMAKRLHALGGAWPVLTRACPSLASAARVRRLSQSARLIVEGEPRFANLSCHLYVLLERQSVAAEFLRRLHQRLWLIGWGHVEVNAGGVILEKSLIDVSVASAERLIFEGPPILVDPETGLHVGLETGLHVDPELDRTSAREGVAMRLMSPLDDEEQATYRRLTAEAKASVGGEAKAKSIAHAEKHGLSPSAAMAFARGVAKDEATLPQNWPLTFRGIGEVSVRQALLDPDAYVGRDLLDPLDPKSGRWQARLLRGRQDGTLFVKSFAHGGQHCQLEYDLDTASKALATCRADQRERTYWSCVRKMPLADKTRGRLMETFMSRKKSGGVGLDHDDDETLDQLKELAQQAGLRDDGRPDDRAEIKLQADRVVENIDAIEASCIARNALLWQRDGAVVNVGLKKYKTADDREAITLCVRDMTTPRLFKIVARCCKFRKFDMRTEDWRAVEPPMKLLESFRHQSELRLPVIKGVLDHPFFRSDWSLVTTPGFDQRSGIFYYDHGLKFPPVPDNPTRDDAVEALKRVKHLFHTFDFVDEANRSVSVIALMTGLCRHMFGAAPIFSIDATMPGSGKGLIVKVISAVVIGDRPPLINQGSTPEETEKRLGSMLREALRIVVFDNCLDDIGGALLCSLATEERVSIRILAKTERHAVSLGSLLIFNGNNVTFRGEVTSRALNSRLDPQCENPDNRHFDYNPVKDANENRPELAAAILTMMQAYKAAGFPDMPKIASRFPDWDRLRGMLIWAGMEDPYETTLKIKRDDPETAEFRAVLQHWFTVIYTRVEMTLGDIVDCAVKRVPIKKDDIIQKNPDGETMYEYAHPEFRQALLAVASSGDNRRIDTKGSATGCIG